MMDREAERRIEWDCVDVLVRFINALDACDYETMAELMAPDGVWIRPGGDLEGPEAVRQAGLRRPAGLVTCHVISNVAVNVIDEDHAEGLTYLTVYRYDGERLSSGPAPLRGPHMVGISKNRLLRTCDGWRIQEKQTIRIFEAYQLIR